MKKLLKLIGKYKIFLGFSVIFAAISVVLQLYVPVLFGDAIDEVVAAHQVNFDMMWYYLRQILVFIVISALATWFMNLLNNRMTYRTGYPVTGNPAYPGIAVILSGSA